MEKTKRKMFVFPSGTDDYTLIIIIIDYDQIIINLMKIILIMINWNKPLFWRGRDILSTKQFLSFVPSTWAITMRSIHFRLSSFEDQFWVQNPPKPFLTQLLNSFLNHIQFSALWFLINSILIIIILFRLKYFNRIENQPCFTWMENGLKIMTTNG